jgi:tetratricopeptide (TPR) repeat protein
MLVTKIPAARLAAFTLLLLPTSALWAAPQTPNKGRTADDRKSAAYYHYSLAHLNEQLAISHTRQEYVDAAVSEYKLAIEADPASSYVRLQLASLYARTDHLNDAVAEIEKVLAQDASDIEARRLLGQVYRSYAAERNNEIDPELLRKSIEQYEKILEIDAADKDSLLQLANLYRAAEQPDKAEAVLQRLLKVEPDSADALSTLALMYLDRGDTDAAIEAFEKVHAKGIANRGQLSALGAAYERAGRNDEAAKIFAEVVEMGGNTTAARASLAHNLVLAGEYDQALEQFQLLVKAEPENPEHYLRLSQIYRQKQDFDSAWTYLHKAQEIAPQSLEVQYNAVLLLEDQERTDEAIEAMQKLIQSTEKSSADQYTARDRQNRALFFEQLGLLHRSRQGYAEARQAFASMGEADPDVKSRALAQTIDTYRAARDYDAARSASQKALAEFPADRQLAMLRATVLAETGDAAEGVKILNKLLTGNARDRDVFIALSQIYEKGKRYDDAVEALEKATALSSSEGAKLGVLFAYGSVLERAKRFDQAEEKFREVLRLDPDNSSAMNYLGYMLADLNKSLDEAHDMIQKALDSEPDNGAYLDSLGWVYYRQDKLDLAERYLLRSLEKITSDPIVHSHLGDVYFKQGKLEQAKQQWELSQQAWEKSPQADRDPAEIAKLKQKLADLNAHLSSRVDPAKTTP